MGEVLGGEINRNTRGRRSAASRANFAPSVSPDQSLPSAGSASRSIHSIPFPTFCRTFLGYKPAGFATHLRHARQQPDARRTAHGLQACQDVGEIGKGALHGAHPAPGRHRGGRGRHRSPAVQHPPSRRWFPTVRECNCRAVRAAVGKRELEAVFFGDQCLCLAHPLDGLPRRRQDLVADRQDGVGAFAVGRAGKIPDQVAEQGFDMRVIGRR
jgi:hypothetical protein